MTPIPRAILFAAMLAIPTAASAQEGCGWLDFSCWRNRVLSAASGPKELSVVVSSTPRGARVFVGASQWAEPTNTTIRVQPRALGELRLRIGDREISVSLCDRWTKPDGTVQVTCRFP